MRASVAIRSSIWPFFVLAYGVSWLFWILAALVGPSLPAWLAQMLLYLGGLGPPLAGISLVYLTQGRSGRRDYWRRVVQFGRIDGVWYGVIVGTVPILAGVAVLGDVWLGGDGAQIEAVERFATQPWAIVPFALFMLLFGPLPEELGWRGYALDRLQVRWSALASSLSLGTAWTLWHLPLFFIEGTYQSGLGWGSLAFWGFMLDKVPQSIVMTWIYNNTRCSTLSAILFHFMINFTGELLTLSQRAELFQLLLWFAAAILVTAIWGPGTLVARRAQH
jgi:membrane protease YdiL (CAAX protease family)